MNFQRQNLGPIRNDVDVAYDLTSHDLSIILYLFNKMPKIISHLKYPILVTLHPRLFVWFPLLVLGQW